jgi:2-polyprenyl-3-methyl-5-hydroxy-6-metoxy-1,4-benzoquinol methylase
MKETMVAEVQGGGKLQPASGKADSFFNSSPYAEYDRYNRNALNRINERYKRIIGANVGHIAGKRVLDLAAHDGRWTWATLRSGASYVESVEGRPELVERATQALSSFPKETWRFSQGDIFDYLENLNAPFDTILCLGIFYHISEHLRLLRLMTRLKPSAIILDTALNITSTPVITFASEKTDRILNAIPDDDRRGEALVGIMSRGLLAQWCRVHEWKLEYIPWRPEDIADHTGVSGYFVDEKKPRARFTCVLTPA